MTILHALWSKATLYALMGIGIVTTALSVLTYVAKASRTSEKLKSASDKLKNMERAKRIEAEVNSLSADAARRQLHDRWGA